MTPALAAVDRPLSLLFDSLELLGVAAADLERAHHVARVDRNAATALALSFALQQLGVLAGGGPDVTPAEAISLLHTRVSFHPPTPPPAKVCVDASVATDPMPLAAIARWAGSASAAPAAAVSGAASKLRSSTRTGAAVMTAAQGSMGGGAAGPEAFEEVYARGLAAPEAIARLERERDGARNALARLLATAPTLVRVPVGFTPPPGWADGQDLTDALAGVDAATAAAVATFPVGAATALSHSSSVLPIVTPTGQPPPRRAAAAEAEAAQSEAAAVKLAVVRSAIARANLLLSHVGAAVVAAETRASAAEAALAAERAAHVADKVLVSTERHAASLRMRQLPTLPPRSPSPSDGGGGADGDVALLREAVARRDRIIAQLSAASPTSAPRTPSLTPIAGKGVAAGDVWKGSSLLPAIVCVAPTPMARGGSVSPTLPGGGGGASVTPLPTPTT